MFGTAISGNVYDKRDAIFSQFCSHVKELGSYAASQGIRLLAENNVLGQTNFKRGYSDALFCVNSQEIIQF